jgi:uncharacterized protein YyaL (SSP411 family)
VTESFRFSPRPNRAHEILWREWSVAAFADAARLDRPVLLNLTATWCHWCHVTDETTYSEPDIIGLINEALIAVRVDADEYPHVQDRYIAGGWPTNAFLTPTGEVLWAGTYITADEFRAVASSVLTAWRERREELTGEIEKRRRALEAARGRAMPFGLVRREAADDVIAAIRDSFDARNGGFGTAPKFPQPEAIELLHARASDDQEWQRIADVTLDGMLAGELWDTPEGGFFRYALAEDWSQPRHEKLLETNAALLDAYAHASVLRTRSDWREIAERIVEWCDGTLQLPSSLWAASQSADPSYFALDREARAQVSPPPIDPTIYTSANARWIAALARTGARLQQDDWVRTAEDAMHVLQSSMRSTNGGFYHYARPGDAPRFDFLLADTLECVRAYLALAQATGEAEWLTYARDDARHIEHHFWADDGGFYDRLRTDHDVGALRYRDRPFELNAIAARVLLDLAHVTGERVWRALAERTLARLGPYAGRYGAAGATFALAIDEFFDAPPAIIIATPRGDDESARALRQAAQRLLLPRLRIWTVRPGHRVGPHQFDADGGAVAYVWTSRGCSPPIQHANALATAATAAR